MSLFTRNERNESLLKGKVGQYITYAFVGHGNHSMSILAFRSYAAKVYQSIGKLLDLDYTDIYDADNYQDFLGTYEIEGDSFEVNINGNELVLYQEGEERKIIPLAPNCFTTTSPGFFYLRKDDQDKVIGLKILFGHTEIDLEKVE